MTQQQPSHALGQPVSSRGNDDRSNDASGMSGLHKQTSNNEVVPLVPQQSFVMPEPIDMDGALAPLQKQATLT